jgi:hypothetical protein
MSIQDDIKRAIEDVLGPDLAAIKGSLESVNARLDRMAAELTADLESRSVALVKPDED